jgi:hypothetical protein
MLTMTEVHNLFQMRARPSEESLGNAIHVPRYGVAWACIYFSPHTYWAALPRTTHTINLRKTLFPRPGTVGS